MSPFLKAFHICKENIDHLQFHLLMVLFFILLLFKYIGWFPYNTYLQAGKIYSWCSCGLSQSNPSCDGSCNANVTRCRPINFNVS